MNSLFSVFYFHFAQKMHLCFSFHFLKRIYILFIYLYIYLYFYLYLCIFFPKILTHISRIIWMHKKIFNKKEGIRFFFRGVGGWEWGEKRIYTYTCAATVYSVYMYTYTYDIPFIYIYIL